jgi:hypothetical protein
MIIALGQARTSRREPDAGGSDWPSYETTGKYLHTSQTIANLVAEHYRSPYQYGRIESIREADGDIRPDQRFYDREYQQAAEILAALFPEGVGKNEWYMFLRNYMGYRLLDMPFCSYGMEPDPVTRKCVQERVREAPRRDVLEPTPDREPTPGLEPRPKPPPDEKDEESKWADLILPLGIVVVLGVVMLSGGRK